MKINTSCQLLDILHFLCGKILLPFQLMLNAIVLSSNCFYLFLGDVLISNLHLAWIEM